MIYKTYRAPTYKDAVLNAKMELGNKVYIIGRKELKEGGFLGLFAKSVTEITVAKSEVADGSHAAGVQGVMGAAQPSPRAELTAPGVQPAPPAQGALGKSTDSSDGKKTLLELVQQKRGDDSAILKELQEIKTRLNELTDGRGTGPERPHLEELLKILNENDFSGDFIGQFRERLEDELTVKEAEDPGVLENKLKTYLGELIEVSGPIKSGNGKPTVVVLVGPTGVGKTTTIAKLAATFGVIEKRRVELITIDSYRIAAVEQLGKYAELMQLPLVVVNTREEFKNAIMNSRAELVFVDTAGRSQKNNMGLAEIRNILDGAKSNLDIHLVISAATKYRDALDVMGRFSQLMYDKLIITKMDETNTIGPLLSAMKPGKRISYVTTGQSVPDDIELANKEKLLAMLALEELRAG
jgi:flagellar biosynthesis protein FlhF